jgi:orotidine-5'-phosphate decarboxylase
MKNDSKDDQKRICTPLESLKNGSNKIIMGRGLIKGNIEENLNKVSNSLKM